jgi:hypothetical protein
MMYVQDYDNCFPDRVCRLSFQPPPGQAPDAWRTTYAGTYVWPPYSVVIDPYVKNVELFVCPAFSKNIAWHYGFCTFKDPVYGAWPPDGPVMYGSVDRTRANLAGVSEGRIVSPAEKPAIVCVSPNFHGEEKIPGGNGRYWSGYARANITNTGWADGHAKPVLNTTAPEFWYTPDLYWSRYIDH